MQSRFFIQLTAAALMIFGGASKLLAIQAIPATVQEAQFPGAPIKTQYTVNDTSSTFTPGGKFDISIFLSTTTGSTPTTTNANWSAEVVTATDWTESMGFPAVSEPANLTWQQYTGMTYTQAYPAGPVKVNGYFLNYAFNSGADTISYPNAPVLPGASLGGFFFTGSPSSTFFVAGPTDGVTSFTPGNVITYSGISTDVPEPGSLTIAVVGGMLMMRRRPQYSITQSRY